MNKTKRFCAIALAAMMAASALTACGGGTASTPTPADTTPTTSDAGTGNDTTSAAATDAIDLGGEDNVTLKVWGPDAAQTILKKQCDDFIAAVGDQASVTIEVVPMGEDVAATQALTDASAAADVFGFACDNLDRLVGADVLTEVVAADLDWVKENNSESSVDAATVNGSVYAFPETGDNSYILVYNKDYVSADQAKTLEGVLEACKAANKKFVMDAGNGFYACTFAFTGGLKIDGLEEDGITQKFTEYDEATVVKTLAAFQDLFAKYKDNVLWGECTKVGDGFSSDTVAAGIDGSWDFSTDKAALGDKAGFAILPTINVDGTDVPRINMFGYKLLGVNAATAFPNTSVELAKYLTSEKCQLERAQELNWGPSNKAAAESDVVKNDEALSSILAQSANSVAQKGLASTFWTPMATLGSKITDFANPMSEDDIKTLVKQTVANIRDE